MKVKVALFIFAGVVLIGCVALAVSSGYLSVLMDGQIEQEPSEQIERVVANKVLIISELDRIDPSTILAEVNGTPIYKKNIMYMALICQIAGIDQSTDELLDQAIRDVLYFDEAKKRGLLVSEQEVEEHVKNVRVVIEESVDASNIKAFIEIQLKALDMTEEEYWAMLPIVYQKAFTVGKLREQIADDEEFEDLYHELIEKARIVYYDHD